MLRRVDRTLLEENRVAPPADQNAVALVGCGHAWNGHRVRIVDPQTMTPRAEDEIGEVWVSGPSIAAGYWNRPQETADTFGTRLGDADDAGFLRTGDLGFLSQGEVFITGRLKDLIIIAGRNYYPQDFERVLDETIEGVKPGCSAAFSVAIDDAEAVVIVAELERGEGRARALKAEDATALFVKIRENLAAVCEVGPAEIVLVRSGAIPKTSSGKIRRSECRRAYLNKELDVVARSRPNAEDAPNSPPSTATAASGLNAAFREAFAMLPREQRVQLATSFLILEAARVLRAPQSQLSADSRLLSCGLSSLGALELKHSMDALLGKETPLAPFLGDATISEIAELAVNGPAPDGGEDADEKGSGRLGLSPSQMAIWAVQRLDPLSAVYNLHLAFDIHGVLDGVALRQASDSLIERHPLLRTIYCEDSTGPFQRRVSSIGEYFSILDAQGWSDAALQNDMSERILEPFDLTRGPLLRLVLYKRSDLRAAALICAHHICLDLWSMLTLSTELKEAYRLAREGRPPKLAAIAADYADFVSSGRRYLESEAFGEDWAYWRRQLAGELPVLALPTDHKRRSSTTSRGGAFPLTLDAALTARVKNMAREEGATLFALLLAVYKLLLYRFTNDRDVIVGSATSGRNQSRFAPVIGNFVNPVALRTRIEPQRTFADYLREVRQCVAEAVAHQDFPFSTLVERLNPARVEGQWPIFQTFFVLHQPQADIPTELTALALGERTTPFAFADWKISGISVDTRAERFDLKLMAAESDGGLILSFQYREDVFDRDTIARLA
ncbi:MAG TPA: condensation domain-containing protein, partial [Methylocystis sp.]|nr:condensation domain-containing protein [Methylocystis sp.]